MSTAVTTAADVIATPRAMARQFEGEMGSLELFNDSIALAENEAKNDKGGGGRGIRGYKIPFKRAKSLDERVGSETKYPNGADEYLNWISEMVPDIAFGHSTRVVFDVDCGTSVQFALECGMPAMLAVFATSRLLYPSQAFDLIPCTMCQINVILSTVSLFGYQNQYMEMERFELSNGKKEGYIAMWRKPVNNTCYASHGAGVQPPICDSDDDPENVWFAAALDDLQCDCWVMSFVPVSGFSYLPVREEQMYFFNYHALDGPNTKMRLRSLFKLEGFDLWKTSGTTLKLDWDKSQWRPSSMVFESFGNGGSHADK
ncbi:hypothetical protein WN944_008249 [Citrus x changshan-huyou]|uniref:Methyltransferase n=1 Tax=Citrus x changshan-huyou TaxID=2935761 RepID=A0AAP0QYQ7_9ROSI